MKGCKRDAAYLEDYTSNDNPQLQQDEIRRGVIVVQVDECQVVVDAVQDGWYKV